MKAKARPNGTIELIMTLQEAARVKFILQNFERTFEKLRTHKMEKCIATRMHGLIHVSTCHAIQAMKK